MWVRLFEASDDADRAVVAATAVVRATLSSVRYLFPATSSLDEPRSFRGFDEVDIGVELDLADGRTYVARWRMSGVCEWLRFAECPSEERANVPPVKHFDVTRSPHWGGLIGQKFVHAELAWHRSDESCEESVWAVWLRLASGRRVVIALGETGLDAEIEYQPDAVVVIFDDVVARRYRIPAATRLPREASQGASPAGQ